MNKNKLDIKSIYEMDNEELKYYDLEEWNELDLFEGDPDYMIDEKWNYTYFFISEKFNTVYISDDWIWNDPKYEKLLNFCESQDPKISLSWYNTRSENDKWNYMDDDEDFYENNWLRIWYRWWCWYFYTCFKYID